MSETNLIYRAKRKIGLQVFRRILTRAIPKSTKRLIVFLSPGHEFRTGGVMAITMMCQESKALENIHEARVVMCTLPTDPPLFRYTWFDDSECMLDLERVLKQTTNLDYLLLHIPDYAVNDVLNWLTVNASALMKNIREIHLNVLIFNIDLMQGQNVAGLMHFGKVTCTTAHEAYSTIGTREAMGLPLHKLLICRGPEFYRRSAYQKKENLLIVSHDDHPLKERVLRKIGEKFPELKIQVIRELSYKTYKELIERAKWSLTFGEGLDGYFAEPTFSGGVAFAVFNERFFTPAFAKLETVYPSWELLLDRIVLDLERLNEPVAYSQCWRQAFDLLSDELNTDRFRENLRLFYRGKYTFP